MLLRHSLPNRLVRRRNMLHLQVGDRVELISTNQNVDVPVGTHGTVPLITSPYVLSPNRELEVDVAWDNDRTTMLMIPPDEIRKV